MARKPNLKRKEPVRFEPLTGEKGEKLLQDIAPDISPKKKGIKIFFDLEYEILDSNRNNCFKGERISQISPEAEYLKNHQNHEKQSGNHKVKLLQDVVED